MQQGKRSFLLIGLAYLSFVSLGLPDGLFGIAWPSVRASFLSRSMPWGTAGDVYHGLSVVQLQQWVAPGTPQRRGAPGAELSGDSAEPAWLCPGAVVVVHGGVGDTVGPRSRRY